MPTVPVRERQVVTAALPGARLTPNAPNVAPAGIDLSGVSGVVNKVVEEERQKADQISITDMSGKLAMLETSIRTSVLSRKGRDAMSSPEEAKDAWEKGSSEITKGATTDRQKAAIHQAVISHWVSLDASIQQHVSTQTQVLDDEVTENSIAAERDAAAKSYTSPERVSLSILRQEDYIRSYAERNGKSEEWKVQRMADAASKTHVSVIERMLTSEEGPMDRLAKKYYDIHKEEITGEDQASIEQKLQSASTDGEALRGADAVWKEFGPKDPNGPVLLSTMEQVVRDKYKDDPKVIKATIQEIRSRAQAWNTQQAETTASNKAAVLKYYNDGNMPLSRIKRTSEYLALSGTEQENVASYIVDRGKTLTERAREEKTRAGFKKYWELSDPHVLSEMSDNEVLSLETELGQELVGDLMKQRRAMLTSDERVKEASIDLDVFKQILRENDVDPDDKDRAEEIGKVKYEVENAIDLEQQARGKAISRSEKDAIMRSILDQKVRRDFSFFNRNGEKSAILVKKDDRGGWYVPIEDVVKDSWFKEAANLMRSFGAVDQNLSDDTLAIRYRRRFELGFGLKLTGGNAESITNILLGRK